MSKVYDGWKGKWAKLVLTSGLEKAGKVEEASDDGLRIRIGRGREWFDRVDIKSVTRLYERPIPWIAKPPLGRMEIRVRIGYMARKNRLSGRERKLLIFEGNLIWVRDGWLKVRYKESEMTETIHQDNIVSFKFV